MDLTRRDMVKLSLGMAAATALWPFPKVFAQSAVITKPIPSSGERIPVIGVGTRDYTSEPPKLRAELKEVLRRLPMLGGSVIDTATGYRRGESETVIGDLVSELGNRDRLFFATKVNAASKQEGLSQIEQSFRRLRTNRIDLNAVHNLRDTGTQLETLREMKQAGRIRYVGITTSSARQYQEFESVMKSQELDFIQVDYALDNRESEVRILPLAADRGMAVMVNMPFGYGRLFPKVQNVPLPDWAKQFDAKSWAQFFLKYVVSHPAVTCAIPGMRRVPHLLDNIQAARGRLPDAAMRRRMEQYFDSL